MGRLLHEQSDQGRNRLKCYVGEGKIEGLDAISLGITLAKRNPPLEPKLFEQTRVLPP